MKQPALAYVVDCNEHRLTGMFKRQKAIESKSIIESGMDILPFDVVPHQHYTLGEALKLKTILNLVDHGGIDQAEASYTTKAIDHDLPIHPLDYISGLQGKGDLWIGVGTVVNAKDNEAFKFTVGGTFDELVDQKDRKMIEEFPGYNLVRFVTTNVSLAANSVRQKAQELGLPEGEDETPGSHKIRRGKGK
ncbi:MAG: hypothetical protein AAF754_07995 [Pseudomonadota bacterium]